MIALKGHLLVEERINILLKEELPNPKPDSSFAPGKGRGEDYAPLASSRGPCFPIPAEVGASTRAAFTQRSNSTVRSITYAVFEAGHCGITQTTLC